MQENYNILNLSDTIGCSPLPLIVYGHENTEILLHSFLMKSQASQKWGAKGDREQDLASMCDVIHT